MKTRAATCAIAAAAVIALKWFYGQAGAAELTWMLGPPCWLASHFGVDLVYESGAGWISHTHHLIVGAACAGVNFFVVCFAMLFFSSRRQWRSLSQSLLLAYVATIAVNTARIVLAAHLYDLQLPPGWLSPGRLHRIAGTIIYCIGLAATYALADGKSWLSPFAWYIAIILGLPLLHAALASQALASDFTEHAFTVCALTAFVALFVRGVRLRANVRA